MDPVLAHVILETKWLIAGTICVVAFMIAIAITYKDQFKK